MNRRLEEYARRQRKFWNVASPGAATYERVYTVEDKSDKAWQENLDTAIMNVVTGIIPEPDWTVLEIGCGVGRMLEALQGRLHVREFIGVDISSQMIDFAREKLGSSEDIRLCVNSGYDLSMISSDSIDFAYSVDVFIHIFDYDIVRGYCSEVFRVLKSGSCFRFNVRAFDPDKAFARTIGGVVARWTYKLGIRSAATHRWKSSEEAEFNGNQYMRRDLARLIRSSGLHASEINSVGDHFWCTARKSI